VKFTFHPSAQIELDQAIDYYESCELDLGLQFSREVYSVVERIVRFPTAWSSFSSRTRRCLTTRFPYGVIYQIKEDNIRIIAVAHLSRRPGYWNERLDATGD
jgi:plasmid stabilization system protein ParE